MKKPTNDNYPIQTKYGTFKKYQENYESDLKVYLDSYEDNTEIAFLEVDLYAHKQYLKHLLTKTADYIVKDEDKINQQKVNTQKRIIDFIENKLLALKGKVSTSSSIESEIDLSDSNAVQKMIYLNELGIIELLRKEPCFASSVNNLANVITAITGEKHSTIQPYLNALLSKTDAENKHPYYTKSTVEKIKNQLINLGVKPL